MPIDFYEDLFSRQRGKYLLSKEFLERPVSTGGRRRCEMPGFR